MAVFILSLFKQRSRALIGLLSKVLTLLLFAHLPAKAARPQNCSPQDLFNRDQYVCAGEIVYAQDNRNSSRRSIGPLKIEGTSSTEVAIHDIKSNSRYNLSNITFSFAKTAGCGTNKICVGNFVRATDYDDTFKVVGIYASSNERGEQFAVAVCRDRSCSTTSEPYFNFEGRELSKAQAVKQEFAKSKRIDSQVLQELQDQFRPFDNISPAQYVALKKAKNSSLIEAQRNLSQYLQSTVTELLPQPGRASAEQIRRANDLRQQFFASPTMVQTGFEILSNELLKPENQIQCSVVVNALRFTALGSDPWGRKAPGLDYVRNQLLVVHFYASYVRDMMKNALPCQAEINSQPMVRPELYEQYHEGCSDAADTECELDRNRYVDAETRLGIMKMARAFNDRDSFDFEGAIKRKSGGLFGNKHGFIARYTSDGLMNSASSSERGRVGLVFYYDSLQLDGAILNSSVSYEPLNNRWAAPASQVPNLNSQQVMSLYSSFAKEFLK
ncbi:hypothetical protein [Bdellovibrio sp. HCB2-146]|uniref:hypothetical protein n=1 Tax=Bdellovibrio sp. HCB2-146 TaxID=3394362 RepID=UPI0039BC8035